MPNWNVGWDLLIITELQFWQLCGLWLCGCVDEPQKLTARLFECSSLNKAAAETASRHETGMLL